MKIIPNETQWKNWTLPSKFSYIGVPLAVLLFIIGFVYTEFFKIDYSKLSYEIQKKLELMNISKEVTSELIYRVEKELNQKINQDIWDEYANIILSIYKSVDSKVIIKLNEKIFCEDSKKSRIIDLAIHSKVYEHDILIAVKLLPIEELIDSNIINYYSQIIKDIGASKGVIICNGGFSKDAVNKAKEKLIDLCTLKDASSRKWTKDLAIPVIWEEVIPNIGVKMIVAFEAGDKMHKDFSKALLSNDNGKTTFTIVDYFIDKWNNNEIPHFSDTSIKINNEFKNLRFRVNKNNWRKINEFAISYYTLIKSNLKYFTPLKYKAIENYITGDTEFSELEIGISPFKNDGSWTKINSKNINIKGLAIIVTVNSLTLNNELTELKYSTINKIK